MAMYKKQLSKSHYLCEDGHAIYVKTVYGKQFLTHGMFNRWLDDPGKPIHWMSGKPPELDEELSYRRPWRTIEEGQVDPYWEYVGEDIPDIDEPKTEPNWEAYGWNSRYDVLAKEVAENGGALITAAAGVGKSKLLDASNEPLRR